MTGEIRGGRDALRDVSLERRIFFGEDLALAYSESERIETPNSLQARDEFLGALTGWETEDFESYNTEEIIRALKLGEGRADLVNESGKIQRAEIQSVIEGGAIRGSFPLSGINFINDFQKVYAIEFDEPKSAFGFFVTDVGDFEGELSIGLTYEDESREALEVPHTINARSGSALYFGLIDAEKSFTRIELINTRYFHDAFGYDDITIATPKPIRCPLIPVTVKVKDDGGGVDTQSFDLKPCIKENLLSIEDARITEGSSGTTEVELTVSLSEESDQPITVDFATVEGTAIAPSDYTSASGSLTFNPGDPLTQTITISVLPDTDIELDETFVVELSNARNATIARERATVTIINDDTYFVSIEDVTITEGSNGTTEAELTVSLSGESDQPITVDFATVEGTAIAPSDYTAASGTLTFNPGDPLTQTITISVLPDTDVELDEEFVVELSNATNATIARERATVTIINDDTYFVSIEDATITEGSNGTTEVELTVSLSGESDQPITVDFATVEGTAIAPEDYTAASGTLTFNPGDPLTQTITISVLPDTDVELDETFVVELFNATNATIAKERATVTIINDDTYFVSIEDVTITEGSNGTTEVELTVSLSGQGNEAITVDLATGDGTAIASSDYTAASGTLTFNPGDPLTQTIIVSVLPDTDVELDEEFVVELSNATNATIAKERATVTIINDDRYFVSIEDVTITEGSSGTTKVELTVSLSGESDQPITVDFATVEGTAIAPEDYTATSGTLTFNPGDPLTQTITISVLPDTDVELDEEFVVELSNATNATIAKERATVTIINDDTYFVSIEDATITEGSNGTTEVELTVSLSGESDQPITVDFATVEGTAIAPEDYTAASGTLTFNPGDPLTQTITISVLPDTDIELDETFVVELSNATNVTILDAQATVTVINDDIIANAAPEFTTTPVDEAAVGIDYIYEAGAHDSDGDPLTYELLSPLEGISVDRDTGILTWRTTTSDIGTHLIVLQVSDGFGGIDRQNYTLEVSTPPPNLPPLFTSPPIVDARVNTAYSYIPTVIDPDGDLLSISLVDGPEGMVLNPDTFEVTWTPTSDQLVIYDVTLRVTDGRGGIAEQKFSVLTLLEAGNAPPLIVSSPETKVYLGADYVYQVEAVDPDADELTYELVSGPEGLTIDPITGEIIGTFDAIGGEKSSVTVQVKDGRGGVDTQSFDLNISARGKITGRVVEELGNQAKTTIVYFKDFENAKDLLTEWSNPEIATAPISSQQFLGEYGGTFYEDEPSKRKATLTLTDLAEHDTVTVNFQLYILKSWDGYAQRFPWNGPDFWELKVGEESLLHTLFSNNEQYNEPQQYPGNLGETHPPHQGASAVGTLGYTYFGRDATYDLSLTFAHDDSTLELNFLGGSNQEIWDESWGLDNVEVRVSSQQPKGIANAFVYLDSNDNRQRDPGELFTQTDEEGRYEFILEPGVYTVAQNHPLGWTQVTPELSVHTVTLEDGQTLTDLDFSNSGSEAENEPPVLISTPPTEAVICLPFRYRALAEDGNGNPLSYALLVKPSGMVIDEGSGQIVWTLTEEQQGETAVIIQVSDGQGLTDIQSFQLGVLPFNTLPVFTNQTKGITARENQPFEYQFQAIDAEGSQIKYRLEGEPVGVTIDTETGLIQWTPTDSQVGSHSFAVIARDVRNGEAIQLVTISVMGLTTNSDPLITSQPREGVKLGSDYLYQLEVFDPDNNPLEITLSGPIGMEIDGDGLVFWRPTAVQFGPNEVAIAVSDSLGGVTRQEFTISVTSQDPNSPPSITSTPSFGAVAGQEYEYNLTETDPDGDLLLWELTKAPAGMTLDALSGFLHWTPEVSQVGNHPIDIRLLDSRGAFTGQAFEIDVRGVNTPPIITSPPITAAAVDKPYEYQVIARDAENDVLTYSLTGAVPEGMTINSATGLISWTPKNSQVGLENVSVLVSDSLGAIASQDYGIIVESVAANLPPAITSVPIYGAAAGEVYSYMLEATDPEGESLTYQLLSGPPGMSLSETGLLSWEPTVGDVGLYDIHLGVVDPKGLGGAQQFALTVRSNNAPNIVSAPVITATPGLLYSYPVLAVDADNDLLSYRLVNGPTDATIDAAGIISWMPRSGSSGDEEFSVRVTDTFGAASTQSFTVSLQGDDTPPEVTLLQSFNFVYTGQSQTLWTSATDDVGVETLDLRIDGEFVALSPDGVATVSFDNPGLYEAIATATDAAGNSASASATIEVLGKSDGSSPVIELDPLPDDLVTNVIELTGTISDDNLAEYRFEVAPVGSNDFVTIFTGTEKVTDGVLGEFDSTLLQNDSYTLRVIATDTSGESSLVSETVDVGGDLKLGNFQLSFTDLEVPVSGIPISVTRTYDSLGVGTQDDFGPGWRLEFRDTELRTSLGRDEIYETVGIRSKAFTDNTRVYVTLPGGKRETFTFSPTPDRLSRYVTSPNGEGGLFHPAFTAQDGSNNTLTVKDVFLTRNPNGEYVALSGTPYNSEDSFFGGSYTLTTKKGIVYEIDATTGDLQTVTDRNGNTLIYTDEGISSDTGVEVIFERDAQGRISSVIDPAGEKIVYSYDAVTGNLVGVRDRANNTTTFDYEAEERPHYLTGINDPLGREAVRNEYDESGRLKRILDVNGEAVELEYDRDNYTQTVKDVFGNSTTYVYDERGNVLTEVDPVGLVIKRTYDDDNNMLTETIITDESGPEGYTTTYSYDGNGNLLSTTAPLGDTTFKTYDSNNNLLSTTDSLGNTTSSTYDSRGNKTAVTYPDGSVATFSYDRAGNLTAITDGGTLMVSSEYDNAGRVIRQVDANGEETAFTYDANGNRLTETRTVEGRTLTSTLTYDRSGRMTSYTDFGGNVSSFEYNAAGNRIASTDGLGRRTEYRYNESGALVETIFPDDTPEDMSDNPRTRIEYDAAGREKARIDQLGRRTEFITTQSDSRSPQYFPTTRRTIRSIIPAPELNIV